MRRRRCSRIATSSRSITPRAASVMLEAHGEEAGLGDASASPLRQHRVDLDQRLLGGERQLARRPTP